MKNTTLQLNRIGLDAGQTEQLANRLNDLLANYSILYQNVRGYHWNVRGEKFFELHAKFEELYNDLFLKIDEVAERILTLGYAPKHAFSGYLEQSEIPVATEVQNGPVAVESILNAFQVLLVKQRELLDLAADSGDEGTNALMSDYIREQEKLVWMYGAYLDRA